MSSGVERPIREMIPLALEVIGFVADCCSRVAIAGSIRRGKPAVRDVEIVAQAKQGVLDRRCDELFRLDVLGKRQKSNGHLVAWGPRYKAAWYRGVPLDLFIVLPDRQWGPTMLIRTGPGEANGVLVTQEGVLNRDGLRGILPKTMQFKEGRLWAHGLAIDTPEEEDVFYRVGLPWLPPHERSARTYQKWAACRAQTWTIVGMGFRQSFPAVTRDSIYLDGQPYYVKLPPGALAQDDAVAEQMEMAL